MGLQVSDEGFSDTSSFVESKAYVCFLHHCRDQRGVKQSDATNRPMGSRERTNEYPCPQVYLARRTIKWLSSLVISMDLWTVKSGTSDMPFPTLPL